MILKYSAQLSEAVQRCTFAATSGFHLQLDALCVYCYDSLSHTHWMRSHSYFQSTHLLHCSIIISQHNLLLHSYICSVSPNYTKRKVETVIREWLPDLYCNGILNCCETEQTQWCAWGLCWITATHYCNKGATFNVVTTSYLIYTT
jgi:hypothetical protein